MKNNNSKAVELLEKYFEINDGICDFACSLPELFDWNLYDIQGYYETLNEMEEHDEFSDKEIIHLSQRVAALQMYVSAMELLDRYPQVYC